MLTKILLHSKLAFARVIKSKKLIGQVGKNKIQTGPEAINEKAFNELQKMRKYIQEQDSSLKQKIENFVNYNMKQQEIINKFIPQPKMQSYNELDVEKVRQEMMLNKISQKYNKSKKEVSIGTKYQSSPLSQEEKDRKKEKILQKIQKQNIEGKQLSFEQQLKQKYPDSLIKKAEEKMRHQNLVEFKQSMSDNFVKEHEKPRAVNLMERRLKKGETYMDLINKDKRQRQQQKLAKAMKKKQTKYLEQLKKQEDQLNIRQTQQIVAFEDEEYYREKGIKQYEARQLNKQKDIQFLEAGQKDLQESSEKYNIFLDQYEEQQGDFSNRTRIYHESSFGLIDKKMRDLQNRLKLHEIQYDIQELKGMKKDLLFNQKKLREEQLQHQKYLLKKQKKKEMKDYFEKIHAEKLREDVDYEKDFKSRFKDIEYDPLDIQGNMQKIKQANLERNAPLLLNKDKKSEHHFQKTQKNIGDFILSCFYQNLLTANQNIYEQIQIKSLKFNEKKTVVHVFWVFSDENFEQNEIVKGKMQKKLSKSSNFISGRMTQYLGLRYGPDIRFYYDSLNDQTKQIKMNLQKQKQKVIEFQLNNLLQKGHIKSDEQLASTKQKLEAVADENIKNMHNRGKILSKKKDKKSHSHSQHNSNSNSRKKTADQRLWENLDKL